MIGKKLLGKKAVPLFDVKESLKERGKEAELTYEQNITYEYAKQFSKLTPAKGRKFLEEAKALEGLDEALAVKLADVLPPTEEKLNLVIPKGSSLGTEQKKQLLELIQKHAK